MAVHGGATVQDHVALVEIDLTAELMIAAAAASEERLSADVIDALLDVEAERSRRRTPAGPGAGARARRREDAA